MKLIKQSVELIPQNDLFEHIERCTRVCYKSEDKQSEHADKFVNKLIANKHLAMLEHGTVYLTLPNHARDFNAIEDYYNNHYSKIFRIHYNNDICNIITTNFRVIYEHNWLDDLKYECEPTAFHEKRYTFRIVTSIGIVRELLRHRNFSFANESTRYCNYSKDKFDKQITFCKPTWITENMIEEITKNPIVIKEGLPMLDFNNFNNVNDNNLKAAKLYLKFLANCQETYNNMIELGWQPQQAREVLPLCTKSELVMTGFKSDWKEFLDKRLYETTGKVHPDMKELAQMIETKLFDNKK